MWSEAESCGRVLTQNFKGKNRKRKQRESKEWYMKAMDLWLCQIFSQRECLWWDVSALSTINHPSRANYCEHRERKTDTKRERERASARASKLMLWWTRTVWPNKQPHSFIQSSEVREFQRVPQKTREMGTHHKHYQGWKQSEKWRQIKWSSLLCLHS